MSNRLPKTYLPAAHVYWRQGLRTDQIARELNVSEAQVANSLAALREDLRREKTA